MGFFNYFKKLHFLRRYQELSLTSHMHIWKDNEIVVITQSSKELLSFH